MLKTRYPRTADELRASELIRSQWYYSVELLPGITTAGSYPPEIPSLPRLMLRRCEVAGMSCLDIGTMEGLIPTLLAKRGAGEVLGVDYSDHVLGKLAAVRHYHDVSFAYRTVGLLYQLDRQIRRKSFDLVNLSGLLYHVFSPLLVLAAVRPLIKRGGLIVISTNVSFERGLSAEFNAFGRLQSEANTFWYPTLELLDYVVRLMRLEPVDLVYQRHSMPALRNSHSFGKPSGYVSVLCRAVEEMKLDAWAELVSQNSWEYRGLCDWERALSNPWSDIAYVGPRTGQGINLLDALETTQPIESAATEDDSHTLTLRAAS